MQKTKLKHAKCYKIIKINNNNNTLMLASSTKKIMSIVEKNSHRNPVVN